MKRVAVGIVLGFCNPADVSSNRLPFRMKDLLDLMKAKAGHARWGLSYAVPAVAFFDEHIIPTIVFTLGFGCLVACLVFGVPCPLHLV